MQICTLTQTQNYANIPPLSFLQAGCPSCHATNSVKALHELTVNLKLSSEIVQSLECFKQQQQMKQPARASVNET